MQLESPAADIGDCVTEGHGWGRQDPGPVRLSLRVLHAGLALRWPAELQAHVPASGNPRGTREPLSPGHRITACEAEVSASPRPVP